MNKRRKGTKVCETCGNCIPIGEGDHLCDDCLEVVISGYYPTDEYLKCKGKRYTKL